MRKIFTIGVFTIGILLLAYGCRVLHNNPQLWL